MIAAMIGATHLTSEGWPMQSTRYELSVPKPKTRRAMLAVAACLAVAGSAEAAGDDRGRFTMSPAEGGVIRLDRETGAMSFCSGTGGNWACKDMPETESALRKRVDELEAEKRAQEADRGLRARPPAEPPSAEAVPPPPGDLAVPTEQDVDKLFDYVEGMVKKFKERLDRLEREAQKEPGVPL